MGKAGRVETRSGVEEGIREGGGGRGGELRGGGGGGKRCRKKEDFKETETRKVEGQKKSAEGEKRQEERQGEKGEKEDKGYTITTETGSTWVVLRYFREVGGRGRLLSGGRRCTHKCGHKCPY